MPVLLVYRKKEQIPLEADATKRQETLEKLEQYDLVEAFAQRWTRRDDGTFKGAIKDFAKPQDFEAILENDLRQVILEYKPEHIVEGPAPIGPRPKGSPFRGLETFDFEHAPIFFGRTRAIAEVKERHLSQAAKKRAFVLIFGMSGCGKSSLGACRRATGPDEAGRH